MIRFKPDVRARLVTGEMGVVLYHASVWSLTADVEVVVTSWADEAPGRRPDSLHRYDAAVDLDVVTDNPDQRRALAQYLTAMLAWFYDVVLEPTPPAHVHVEYDVRRHRGAIA